MLPTTPQFSFLGPTNEVIAYLKHFVIFYNLFQYEFRMTMLEEMRLILEGVPLLERTTALLKLKHIHFNLYASIFASLPCIKELKHLDIHHYFGSSAYKLYTTMKFLLFTIFFLCICQVFKFELGTHKIKNIFLIFNLNS